MLDKLVVSTSCSLLHTAVDLVNETRMDEEIKSWLAFAAQKLVEVNALAKALKGEKDEVLHYNIMHSIRMRNCFLNSSTLTLMRYLGSILDIYLYSILFYV